MEISARQTEEGELLAICNEGVELLCLGRYEEFIDRFNYACSYDRDPVEALREDISIRLNEIGSQAISAENASRQGKVVFYKMNSENLIAVVSVPALAESGGEVLVEFVVTKVGSQNHVLTRRSSRSLCSLGRPALRALLRMASPLLRKRRYTLAAP